MGARDALAKQHPGKVAFVVRDVTRPAEKCSALERSCAELDGDRRRVCRLDER